MPRKKLTPQQAKAMLIADGVDFSQDFHSQDRYVVGRLEELAKAAGYRKSKNAPGSTVRMFYQYLSRVEPVERGAGQLTPAERRGYQERARKKTPAQLDAEIAQTLASPTRSHATRSLRSSGHRSKPTRGGWAPVVGSHGLGTADVRTGEGAYWIVTVPTGHRVDYKPWGPSSQVNLGTFPSRRQARAKITAHAGSMGASVVS